MPTTAPPRSFPAVKLITVPDAALALGVSARLVWRLLATGALPGVRVSGRSTRIRTSDLEKYIASLPAAR